MMTEPSIYNHLQGWPIKKLTVVVQFKNHQKTGNDAGCNTFELLFRLHE